MYRGFVGSAMRDAGCLRRNAECAQVSEEFFGVSQGLFIRSFEPAEFTKVLDTRGFEDEDDFREVQAFDFGKLLLWAMAMFFTGPEAQANAGSSAARAASPLVGGGLTDFFDQERVDAAIRIVTRNPGQTAIDDAADAIDRERSLCDVCRDDDFALVITGYGSVLIVGRKFAVQRKQDEAARFVGVANSVDGLRDFEAAGHENEDIAFGARKNEIAERFGGLFPNRTLVDIARSCGVSDFDGMGAALRFDDAAGFEVIFKTRDIESRGHDEDLEVGTFFLLQI